MSTHGTRNETESERSWGGHGSYALLRDLCNMDRVQLTQLIEKKI